MRCAHLVVPLLLTSTVTVTGMLSAQPAQLTPPARTTEPAAAPHDPVEAAIAAYHKRLESFGDSLPQAEFKKAAQEAMDSLDLEALNFRQLARLMNFDSPVHHADGMDRLVQRIEHFIDDTTAQGAAAALITFDTRLTKAKRDPETAARMLRHVLHHPGFPEALGTYTMPGALVRLATVSDATLREAKDDLKALRRILTPELAPALVSQYTRISELLMRAAGEEPRPPEFEAMRLRMIALAEGLLAESDERSAERYRNTIAELSGRHHRGELLNHAAPPVEILWSSDGTIRSLDDLKGRVVMIDFWATWCGPCIASFPQVRELVERYKGYPVTVLGVTSLQGRHISRKQGVIPTRDDPQKEFALMAEYIEEMEMTWPVVFTRERVFNPDYGVRGIPHVVIIDPAGVVRHTHLHAGGPIAEKAAKIDALLREAGLPTPE